MKDKKDIILIVAAILVLIVVTFAIFGRKKENTQEEGNVKIEEFVEVLGDGTKLNTSNKLKETKKVNGLEISNIQLTNNNGISVLLADVKNNSGKSIDTTFILITLLDKNGKTLSTIEGVIGQMGNGETTQLNTSVTSDYSNAYDFTVKIK